jgi:hypothetical protein
MKKNSFFNTDSRDLLYKTVHICNACKFDRLHKKLALFVIVSHFHLLGQKHQLTMESVHCESIMVYSTGPRSLLENLSLVIPKEAK